MTLVQPKIRRTDVTLERIRPLLDSGMSINAVSKLLGCTHKVIKHRLNPPLVKQKYSTARQFTRRDFLRWYWGEGKTLREIADQIDSCPWSVYQRMNALGCPIRRSKGEATRLETRIRMSASRRKIPVDEWKGFYVPLDPRVRAGSEYQQWKRQIFKRDKQCLFCGTTKRLTGHHIVPMRDAPERRTDTTNGATLCSSCHYGIANKEHLYAPFLQYRVSRAAT